MLGVYILAYSNDNRVYVGSSEDIEKCYKRHIKELKLNTHHNYYMKELYKNGNTPIILHTYKCETRKLAFELEQVHIDKYLATNRLLNISLGARFGDTLTNNPLREDILARRTESCRIPLSKLTIDERKSLYGKSGKRNGMYGRTHTDAVKLKLSERMKGVSPKNKGIRMSEERLEKHRLAMKVRDITGERNGFFGKSHSEDTKKILSEKASGRVSPTRKAVMIDDVHYTSYTDVFNRLGIPIVTTRWRCLSENVKFKDWKLL